MSTSTDGKRSRASHMTAPLGETLPRKMRLNKADVAAVLKFGKKIRVTPMAQPPSLSQSGPSATNKNAPSKFSLKAHIPERQGTNASLMARASGVREKYPQSRIAIAVPKRLLKLAVSRNAVKRWIREAFRLHAMRQNAVDILVTLELKLNPKSTAERQAAQYELQRLFAEAVRRLPGMPQPQALG